MSQLTNTSSSGGFTCTQIATQERTRDHDDNKLALQDIEDNVKLNMDFPLMSDLRKRKPRERGSAESRGSNTYDRGDTRDGLWQGGGSRCVPERLRRASRDGDRGGDENGDRGLGDAGGSGGGGGGDDDGDDDGDGGRDNGDDGGGGGGGEPNKKPDDFEGLRYHLSVRQQSVVARACGFADRNRIVFDPPPILELKINDPNATPEEIRARLRNQYYVVHCSLWAAESDVEYSPTKLRAGDGSNQRRLMGTMIASPFFGLDEYGQEGCFFAFPDLSCRTTGRYHLKFNMILLDPSDEKRRSEDRRPFEASAISQVITVYAPNKFPGLSSSSMLTRKLKEQGCLISVKKGIERVGAKMPKREMEESPDEMQAKARPIVPGWGSHARDALTA